SSSLVGSANTFSHLPKAPNRERRFAECLRNPEIGGPARPRSRRRCVEHVEAVERDQRATDVAQRIISRHQRALRRGSIRSSRFYLPKATARASPIPSASVPQNV